MKTSENPNQPRTLGISAEAMIGTGITVGCLGLLGLLLGWAQQMREVPGSAALWFVLGTIFVVAGILVATVAGARRRRR